MGSGRVVTTSHVMCTYIAAAMHNTVVGASIINVQVSLNYNLVSLNYNIDSILRVVFQRHLIAQSTKYRYIVTAALLPIYDFKQSQITKPATDFYSARW